MDTGTMILGFLMSGPKTGYKIKHITGKMMVAYNLSLNQIYPALRKLETANLVKKEVVFQTGKPNKHVYTITNAGKELFMQSLVGASNPMDYDFDFLVKLFFFRFLDRENIIRQFEQEILSIEEQLEDFEQVKSVVKQEGNEDGNFIYATVVSLLQLLRDRYSAELEKRKKAYASSDDSGK
ncbi:MAG TPA: PadR family transcriptional regulator [Syntrophales bacterium]|nr:PadR family transcriptional regulator [Syntrophales bacterium]HPQ43880.1 PadR family transcriptional regulator [Syntrophales bacterium]